MTFFPRLALACALMACARPLPAADASPRVTESPADVTTNVGGAASFRVVVESGSGLSYQWYHDDQLIAAATEATFVIPRATTADAGRYQVVARTATGSLTAGTATLTVKPPPAQPIVDPTFHGDAALTGSPTVFLPLGDGRVLLATTTVVSSWDFNAHANLFRLLADGRIDPAFRVGTALGQEFPQNINGATYPPETPAIRQLIAQPDGRVIVVGNFATLNGAARGGIARLKLDGTLDDAFVPAVSTLDSSSTVSNYSHATVAALQPDGKILVLTGTTFGTAQLVRLEVDGRRDPTFAPSTVSPFSTALALTRIGRILIGSGGPFARDGGGRVVALSSDGQPDPTFAPYTCDPVLRLYALDSGSIVATTQFDRGPSPGGSTLPRLPSTTFRLRADGSPDPEFRTRATVLLTPPAPDGSLFLDGKLIAPDGVTETTPNFGVPSQAQPNLFSITPGSAGRLWVTGTFSFFNGVSSSRIARLNVPSNENLAAPRVLSLWADKLTVKLGETTTLHVAPIGEGPLTYTWLWPFNGGVFAVTNEPTLKLPGSTAGDLIDYQVRVANSAGAVTSQPITIKNDPAELRIAWQPRRVSLTAGRRGAISVTPVPGAQPNVGEWRRDGEILRPDVNGRTGIFEGMGTTSINFGAVQPAHAGTYSLTLRDKLGQAVTSDPIVVTVGDSSRFTNLSTRAQVGPGEQAAILGFVIPPGQSRKVLLRGIGPGLASFGINDPLADPRLDLFDSSGRALQRSNAWQLLTSNNDFNRVGAFPLASGSRDTAVDTELQPGSYTVRLASLSNASGVGLIEIYEDDTASDRLFNLSSRVFVGAGANGAAIAGFAIRGPVSKRVLVRAAGPALAALHVDGPLSDPQIEIRDSQGTLVTANDDWQNQPNATAIVSAALDVGAFPFAPGSKDAALVLTLDPGNYSAVVASKNATSGTALLEIYELP